MALTKEQMMVKRKLTFSEPIRLPEKTDDTFVRELTGGERGRLDNLLWGKDASGKAKVNTEIEDALWVVACQCNESCELLWETEDFAFVQSLPANELELLAGAARKINGWYKLVVEEAAKNSPAAPSGSSPTV